MDVTTLSANPLSWIINALDFLFKIMTTISVYVFKLLSIPIFILKFIPGVSKLIDLFEGHKTQIINSIMGIIAVLSGLDIANIGKIFCSILLFASGLFHMSWTCDTAQLLVIQALLLSMMNLALKVISGDETALKTGIPAPKLYFKLPFHDDIANAHTELVTKINKAA